VGSIKESGKTVCEMEKENILGLMVRSTKEIGYKIKHMEKENLFM